MSNDLDSKLDKLGEERSGKDCSVAHLLSSLDERTARKLLEKIDNPKIRISDIGRVLSETGFQIASQTLGRHRKRGFAGGCRCERES